MALPLATSTFADIVADTLVYFWVDNQGVLFGVLKGSMDASDLNVSVGNLWLDTVRLRIGSRLGRVESAAILADGPSRDDLSFLQHLRARFVEPSLPPWAYDLWRCPS